jgi:hypothetical protein
MQLLLFTIELDTKNNTIMNNILINSKVAKESEESSKRVIRRRLTNFLNATLLLFYIWEI